MKSLFGDEIPERPARVVKDRAHPAPPGSGPEGKTCKDCHFYCVVEYHDKTYRKCVLMHMSWSHGPATDIRARDKACRRFGEKK